MSWNTTAHEEGEADGARAGPLAWSERPGRLKEEGDWEQRRGCRDAAPCPVTTEAPWLRDGQPSPARNELAPHGGDGAGRRVASPCGCGWPWRGRSRP